MIYEQNLIIKTWEKWLKIFFQLGFSSEIKVAQPGSARLGTFIARLGSSRKIPARAHHYYLTYLLRRKLTSSSSWRLVWVEMIEKL
jgi:hypothetical protein